MICGVGRLTSRKSAGERQVIAIIIIQVVALQLDNIGYYDLPKSSRENSSLHEDGLTESLAVAPKPLPVA